MSVAAKTIDKKINNYLSVLNPKQKKAILTIARTFAEEQVPREYSDELKAELDSRYEDYKNGGVLINEEEANRRISSAAKTQP